MSCNIRPLPPLLQKVANEELNESPKCMESDLSALKDWLAKQPHLTARTDDQFLVAFLRGCKYSLETAKTKIEQFYTLKALIPEMWTNLNVDEPKLKRLIELGTTIRMPTPLHNEGGPVVTISKAGLYEAHEYKITDVFKIKSMTMLIQMLEDDNAVVSGVHEIVDMSKATMAHFLQMTPALMKKMSMFADEAIPLRQKGAHFINTPVGFEQIFNLFKSFLSDKIKERFFIHGANMDSLYSQIPKEYLPSDYGGNGPSYEELAKQMADKIFSYKEYFLEESKYFADESKRVGGAVNIESLCGIDGSFRKLSVD